MNLQRNIKYILRQRGLTQYEIAEKMGITASALSVSIRNNPTLTTIEQIAGAIGCQIADLFADGDADNSNAETDTAPAASITCPHCGASLNITLTTTEN